MLTTTGTILVAGTIGIEIAHCTFIEHRIAIMDHFLNAHCDIIVVDDLKPHSQPTPAYLEPMPFIFVAFQENMLQAEELTLLGNPARGVPILEQVATTPPTGFDFKHGWYRPLPLPDT